MLKKRRFFSLILIFALFFSFSLSAFALGPEDLAIELVFEMIQHYGESATGAISDMSGDEFYNYITNRPDFNSAGLYALMEAVTHRHGLGGTTVTNSSLESLFGLMDSAHYNKLLINRDILDRIQDLVNNGGLVDIISLTDLSIETSNKIDTLEWGCFGQPMRQIEHGASEYAAWGGYYCSPPPSEYNLSVIHFPLMPPAIYIGSAALPVTQYGSRIPSGLYFIADNSTLVPGYNYENGAALSWREDVNSLNGSLVSGCRDPEQYSPGGKYLFRYAVNQIGEYYFQGVSITLNVGDSQNLSLYESLSMRIGSYINTDGYQPFELPEIPYDDNGDVFVFLPPEGGDPVYMSPEDYNTYVNNGTIIEGDAIETNYLSEETINNIVNNFPSSDTDSDFENDSVIISKLDIIISWLRKIYDKINIDSKQTILDSTFGGTPVYENFSDCITLHIPLVNDISNLVSSLNTEQSDNGLSEIGIYESNGSNNLVQSSFDGFTLDLSWYNPYRQRIRDLLKIPCWILGIVCVWFHIKSIFGIQSSGAGSDE